MEDTKKWWQSKTIWASLVAIGAVAAGFFGIDVGTEDQAAAVDAVAAVVGSLASLFAIYGRLTAEKIVETSSDTSG